MSPHIRFVPADDHELVLEGLRSLREAEPDVDELATVNKCDELIE